MSTKGINALRVIQRVSHVILLIQFGAALATAFSLRTLTI
jgi:hypothetical protein